MIPARGRGDDQLPLRARPLARVGRGAAARARRPRRRDPRELAARARRRSSSPARRGACARPGDLERRSRSRPGRTSPTSPRAGSTPSTSGRARPATRTRSTSGSRSPSSSGPSRRCSGSSRVAWLSVQLSPVLAELDAVSVRAARRLEGRGARPRDRADRLRHRRSARAHARVHPRGAARRRSRRSRPTRARPGCPSCARRSRAGSTAASASTSTRRARSCRRSARRRRSSRSPQVALGEKRARRDSRAGVSGLRARRALRRRRRSSTVPLREEHGWLPDLDAFDAWDEIALFWTCYPNNPTGATAPLSFYEELAGPCARARLPALLRRGVLGALVRRAAGLGAPGRRPDERRRLQHALEALVDDGLPLRLRLRARRGRRRAAARSGRRSARRRRSSCSAPRSRPGRTTSTSRRSARSTAASATRCCPALEAGGLRLAGSARDVLPLARRRRPVGAVRAPAARARHRLRAGLVLRAGRRGLRALRARADAGRMRARGGDPARGPVTTEETIAALDRGEVRVAEPDGDDWRVNADVQAAILDYFRLRADGAARGRAVRVPRQDPAQDAATRSSACASCRRRPPATARSSRAASC